MANDSSTKSQASERTTGTIPLGSTIKMPQGSPRRTSSSGQPTRVHIGMPGVSGMKFTPTPRPSKLNEYTSTAQRLADKTFEEVQKGTYGLELKHTAERNEKLVRDLIHSNALDKTMSHYVAKHRDEAVEYISRPEVAAGINRREKLESELKSRGLLQEQDLQSEDFKGFYESEASGVNAAIYGTTNPFEKLSDEEYVAKGVDAQTDLLYRYAELRPNIADDLGIQERIQYVPRPQLPTPSTPSLDQIPGFRSLANKGLDKATGMITEKVAQRGAGKAAELATGKAVEKVTGAIGTRVGAALGSVLGPVGTAIGAAIGKVLGKIAVPVFKFIRRHSKDFAAIGVGLLGLGTLMGSTLIGGIGAGLVGLSLGGGGLTGLMAGIGGFGSLLLGLLLTVLFPIILPTLIAILAIVFFVAATLFIINTSGYLTPKSDPLAPPNAAISEYFDVSKSASPDGPFSNTELPLEVTYTVTIQAGDEALTNITFLNSYNIVQTPLVAQAPAPSLPEDITPPTSIPANGSHTLTYVARFDESFDDSTVCDNFTVSAVADGNPSSETSTVCIDIGNPPDECPAGWPVATNDGQEYYVNQGPNGNATHLGHEAIDAQFGGPASLAVILAAGDRYHTIATHRGTVVVAGRTDGGSLSVGIQGTCAGTAFTSWHGHHHRLLVKVGDTVTRGTPLGIVGMTGYAKSGPHDHYEFLRKVLPMGAPYLPVPRNAIVGCVGRSICGVDIP
jgi:hypothetical protein